MNEQRIKRVVVPGNPADQIRTPLFPFKNRAFQPNVAQQLAHKLRRAAFPRPAKLRVMSDQVRTQPNRRLVPLRFAHFITIRFGQALLLLLTYHVGLGIRLTYVTSQPCGLLPMPCLFPWPKEFTVNNFAVDHRHSNQRNPGTVDEVDGLGCSKNDYIGSSAGSDPANVMAPQRRSAPSRCRPDRLVDGHMHFTNG
jgi:hypothetical protein